MTKDGHVNLLRTTVNPPSHTELPRQQFPAWFLLKLEDGLQCRTLNAFPLYSGPDFLRPLVRVPQVFPSRIGAACIRTRINCLLVILHQIGRASCRERV